MTISSSHYQDVTLQTSFDLFEETESEELFDYWKQLSRDGALPQWLDYNADDVPKVVPYLTLIEVCENQTSFNIKMVGSELARQVGSDATKLELGRYESTDPFVIRLRAAVETRRGYYLTNASTDWLDGIHKKYSTLMLPTTDEEGKVICLVGWVGNFIACAAPLRSRDGRSYIERSPTIEFKE